MHPFENTPGDPTLLMAVNGIAGIGKVMLGLIPLVLVRAGRMNRLRQLLLLAAWVVGIGMCVYGGLGLISDVLHVSGVIADAANRQWFLVYLVLWDPWWILGGILYAATAWLVQSGRIAHPDQLKD